MNDQALIVVADQDAPHEPVGVQVQAVLDHWSPRNRPPVLILSLAQVLHDLGVLTRAGVVWIVQRRGVQAGLYELIDAVQERHLPALLMRADEQRALGTVDHDGVVICPWQTSPAVVCSMLQGLWSQSPVLRALRAEIHLLRAHGGGLCGQIDRMDEELRLAAQLQREFLPAALPRVGDMEFGVLWRPAGYVSGDIYDIIRLDEDHVGLFVADAVGHGVPAALMTMYIKRALHTKQIAPELPRGYRLVEPAEAMDRLNRDLLQQAGDRVRFATACYGLIDCQRRTACFARAGHPPPLLLRAADGRTESIEPDGGLLGVFPEQSFEQVDIQLEPGDRLLLYSDGFEVAFPGKDGEKPGARKKLANHRYCQEFQRLRHGSIDASLQQLQQLLDEQAGSLNQRDDLTVLCLSVVADAAEKEPVGELEEAVRISA